MLKKLCFCLAALCALAACNDDKEDPIRYPETNECIENGQLTGTNMHFLGTATSTDSRGNVFTDTEARFETAGLATMMLYMHQTRFSAAMPAMEMRMPHLAYTGSGKTVAFSAGRVVPELSVKNLGWQPMEAYALTDVDIRIEGVRCSVRFTCDVPRVGLYTVEYEGRLFVENN